MFPIILGLKKLDKNNIKSVQSEICNFCNKGFESDFTNKNKDVIL